MSPIKNSLTNSRHSADPKPPGLLAASCIVIGPPSQHLSPDPVVPKVTLSPGNFGPGGQDDLGFSVLVLLYTAGLAQAVCSLILSPEYSLHPWLNTRRSAWDLKNILSWGPSHSNGIGISGDGAEISGFF
jgi:hypothetical protein